MYTDRLVPFRGAADQTQTNFEASQAAPSDLAQAMLFDAQYCLEEASIL